MLAAGALLAAGGAIAGVAGAASAAPHRSDHHGGVAAGLDRNTVQSSLRQVGDVVFPAPYANPTSFDISWVDPATQTYYLADRTNDGIDAINAANDTFGSVIGAGDFTGSNTGTNVATAAQIAACGSHGTGGPNGDLTLSVSGVDQLVGGNGVSGAAPVSNVKVFTLSTPTSGTLAATIPTAVAANGTTGTCRADEMAYDPADQLLLVANDLDSPPYLSFISMNANPSLDTIVGQIKFPNATGGIEQEVYDPETHLFYVNIPGVEVAAIDPKSMAVSATYPTTNCTASGLALDEQTQDMLLSCSVNPNGVQFMDARNGRIVADVPEVSGADEVWFDPGTNHYYLAASGMTSTASPLSTTPGSFGYVTPVLGAIAAGESAESRGRGPLGSSIHGPSDIRWVENVPEPTTQGSHSVAADPVNGQVLFPLSGAGIAVFAWTSAS